MGELKPFINIGPGELIRNEIEERGWTQKTFAGILGISVPRVNRMLKNKDSISYERANLLAKAFGATAQFWINADINYRLRMEEANTINDIIAIKAQINTHMPIQDMIKKRWLQPYRKNYNKLIEQIKQFWNVSSIDFSWMDNAPKNVHYRKADQKAYNSYYSLTWLQRAKELASNRKACAYNRSDLENLSEKITEYTMKPQGVKGIIEKIYSCGVKFFILEHLEKTYTDGASFIDEKSGNPVIVYTKRFDRIDNFWFTIAHEMGHVVKHLSKGENDYFIDCLDEESIEQYEQEANTFAATILKHDLINSKFNFVSNFITMGRVQKVEEEIQINRSIIIGTLQHYKKISYKSELSSAKQKIGDGIPVEYYANHKTVKKSKMLQQ